VTREWTRLGENVGYAGSVEGVHAAYMNSPGHRANILGDYNRVGLGATRDANGRLWTTVVFLRGPSLTAPAPTPNHPAVDPFPSAEAFTIQQYRDVLARSASADEVRRWATAFREGRATPAAVPTLLVSSAESAMVVDPVNRLYLAYFRRTPDAAGLTHWVGQLRSGAGLEGVSTAFASSEEFGSTYGARTDEGFVDLVYRNVLGRPSDEAGRAYWTRQLASGQMARGEVMTGFSESDENRGATALRNEIVETYVALLRRPPDDQGFEHWATERRNGSPLSELVTTLLDSDEYTDRFDG
jgi:hypothetical protein